MAASNCARIKVLIVDDDPSVLDGLRRALRRIADSWEVTFAQDGAEALMTAKLYPFDVLITDIRMPNMHGIALLGRFSERYPNTMRVAFSDKFDALTVYSLTECSHSYISKPCTAGALYSFVNERLAGHRLRVALADGVVNDDAGIPTTG